MADFVKMHLAIEAISSYAAANDLRVQVKIPSNEFADFAWEFKLRIDRDTTSAHAPVIHYSESCELVMEYMMPKLTLPRSWTDD